MNVRIHAVSMGVEWYVCMTQRYVSCRMYFISSNVFSRALVVTVLYGCQHEEKHASYERVCKMVCHVNQHSANSLCVSVCAW